MKVPIVQFAQHFARLRSAGDSSQQKTLGDSSQQKISGSSSYRKTGLPQEIPIQTVSLQKASFKHAGLGLSAQTTRMLGKAAIHLEENPSDSLEIRDYQIDTNSSALNSVQGRVKLVKAFLASRGIDASRFVVKVPSFTGRVGSRINIATEMMVKIIGSRGLQR